ncbi:unnamed protein product [Thelazia callipaeda]|uniref:T6PP_N domain-containing protein n=1 Tax=Thelazia callipaeda TaxID=103827 RepID=A0A0N5CK36_THECL|nr:unnamed protein product [Thelazia callipaeda]
MTDSYVTQKKDGKEKSHNHETTDKGHASRWSNVEEKSRNGGEESIAKLKSTSQECTGINNSVQTVDEFKNLMYEMQKTRRLIVDDLLSARELRDGNIQILERTYERLTDNQTHLFQREMCTKTMKLSLNIKDEILGLKKDLKYLKKLLQIRKSEPNLSWFAIMSQVDLISLLAGYHPESKEKFVNEYEKTVVLLRTFVNSAVINGKKPIFVTDWDGTMKDYCSQYATNFQPVYSAIGMIRFADCFTRISAVLTAGPLRGPGILDLTAMPVDGPVKFSGSWGREWWLSGRRVVHEDGITEEGFSALQRLDEEMKDLLRSSDYASFALVGSGVQRKVDRLTLGVQTVCHHVTTELSNRYQMAVLERMHRVDPNNAVLVFDPSTELEVEVVAHSSGIIWNKADGVDRLIKSLGDSLETPGKVLICGDTASDLPMVRQAARCNPSGVMAIFVSTRLTLHDEVLRIIGDINRCCFVSCPDVIHAAMSQILREENTAKRIF